MWGEVNPLHWQTGPLPWRTCEDSLLLSARLWTQTFPSNHMIGLYQETISTAPRKNFGAPRGLLLFSERIHHNLAKPFTLQAPYWTSITNQCVGLTLCICKSVPLPWQTCDNHVDSNIFHETQYDRITKTSSPKIQQKETYPRNYQSTMSQPLNVQAHWPCAQNWSNWATSPWLCCVPS